MTKNSVKVWHRKDILLATDKLVPVRMQFALTTLTLSSSIEILFSFSIADWELKLICVSAHLELLGT
jgi:hypothetical protein